MSSAFDFFERIYCINLPERTDRKEKMIEQFSKVGIADRVIWVDGVRPHPDFEMNNQTRNSGGMFGCTLGHLRAIVDAIKYQQHSLFFEDDAVFADDACDRLAVALEQLPSDWSMLYLGGQPIEPLEYAGPSLAKVKNRFDLGHAYAIAGDSLLDFFNFWTMQATLPAPEGVWDNILAAFASHTDSGYCVSPPIAYQPFNETKSDIEQQEHLFANIVEYNWRAFAPIEHDRHPVVSSQNRLPPNFEAKMEYLCKRRIQLYEEKKKGK